MIERAYKKDACFHKLRAVEISLFEYNLQNIKNSFKHIKSSFFTNLLLIGSILNKDFHHRKKM
jgi:hypothetical protein